MTQSPDRPPTYRALSPTDRDASWSPDLDAIPLADDDSCIPNASTLPIETPHTELAAAVLDDESGLARPSQPSFERNDLEDAISFSSELSPCPSDLDVPLSPPSATPKPITVEVSCIQDVWGPIKWKCARATCSHDGRKAKSQASRKIAAYSELRRDWGIQNQEWDDAGQEMPKGKQQASHSKSTSRRKANWPPLSSKDFSSNSRSSSVDSWPQCGSPIDMAKLRAQWTRERREWDAQDRLRRADHCTGTLDLLTRVAHEDAAAADPLSPPTPRLMSRSVSAMSWEHISVEFPSPLLEAKRAVSDNIKTSPNKRLANHPSPTASPIRRRRAKNNMLCALPLSHGIPDLLQLDKETKADAERNRILTAWNARHIVVNALQFTPSDPQVAMDSLPPLDLELYLDPNFPSSMLTAGSSTSGSIATGGVAAEGEYHIGLRTPPEPEPPFNVTIHGMAGVGTIDPRMLGGPEPGLTREAYYTSSDGDDSQDEDHRPPPPRRRVAPQQPSISAPQPTLRLRPEEEDTSAGPSRSGSQAPLVVEELRSMPKQDLISRPANSWPTGDEYVHCHQCRSKSNRLFIRCQTCVPAKIFCIRCMETRYESLPADMTPFVHGPRATCPFCEKWCTCDRCCTRRGQKYKYVGKGFNNASVPKAEAPAKAPPKPKAPKITTAAASKKKRPAADEGDEGERKVKRKVGRPPKKRDPPASAPVAGSSSMYPAPHSYGSTSASYSPVQSSFSPASSSSYSPAGQYSPTSTLYSPTAQTSAPISWGPVYLANGGWRDMSRAEDDAEVTTPSSNATLAVEGDSSQEKFIGYAHEDERFWRGRGKGKGKEWVPQ
ncbi:hypothetical protein CYLTODRAFT_425245 [Cylindrobasidium torrendii FP15055 ss-10]|uniref:Zinc-finger domain-containing protein n=1 Tax=Cylindrobasidium torrendii FP15055 ss-10 TaxID=1314674 RepID=A0A0D7B2L7_9AGAR|nr:hypothetical protein CYLTODRAFT_425245 [Cylindrobasidium torrendii FP15055 ss-10]